MESHEAHYNDLLLLEAYRNEYEEFMQTSTKNKTHTYFTEVQQIVRYSKHLAFWYMQLNKIKHAEEHNPQEYNIIKDREPFIKKQIIDTMAKMNQMFSQEVILKINHLANKARQEHNNIIHMGNEKYIT